MSIGIACFPEHGDSSDSLIQAADDALYQAKEQGRNRYVAAVPGPPSTVRAGASGKRRKGPREKGARGPKTA